ncbi:hypothetical protein EVAR_44153_1 [Eumeta japonica]|uniref:Uncharacterized protein n=1 Tax=Eumeta variegata TaxID=151549 RepID=A0A4C1XLT1_EUMVA|nr:hypothetical protein EVAR_44153_1 [Eumeta japonica]
MAHFLHHLIHSSTTRLPFIRYSIPTQEAGNAVAIPLEFRVTMGVGDYLFSGRSSCHVPEQKLEGLLARLGCPALVFIPHKESPQSGSSIKTPLCA